MKKISILPLFMGISFLVNSQVKQEYKHYQKGQNQISTTLPRVGVTPGSFYLQTNLRYGHFIKDKWLLGIDTKTSLNYFHQALAVGVYSRYYFRDKKWSPFVGAGFYTGKTWHNNHRIEPNHYYASSTGQSVDMEAGVAYWFNKTIGIELALKQPLYYKSELNGLSGGGPFTHTQYGNPWFRPLIFAPEFRVNFNF